MSTLNVHGSNPLINNVPIVIKNLWKQSTFVSKIGHTLKWLFMNETTIKKCKHYIYSTIN